jgi:hypothetical protein
MGEGFKLAVILVVCFWLTAMASLYAVMCGKIEIDTLKELFTGIGTLAATFGINGIIMAYVVTRGKTSPDPCDNPANPLIK